MAAKPQDSSARSASLAHVDQYLSIGQQAGASDIHLGVNAPPLWRVHGHLQPIWPDAARFSADETNRLTTGFLTDAQKKLLEERGDAAGAVPDDQKTLPGNFVKKAAPRR